MGIGRGEINPELEKRRQEVEWKDGRAVAIRPEIRNSVLEKSYILRTPEQIAALEQTMGETIMRRRAMTPDEQLAELQEIAALAGEEI
jgi:hypothetical protein